MSVQINYKSNNIKKGASNSVLFVDEKFNLSNLKKHILNSEYLYISDLLKVRKNKDKIATFEISSKKKFFLVSVKNNFKVSEAENLGAKFYDLYNELKQNEFILNSDSLLNQKNYFSKQFINTMKATSLLVLALIFLGSNALTTSMTKTQHMKALAQVYF